MPNSVPELKTIINQIDIKTDEFGMPLAPVSAERQ
jgi:hypothetical protein